MDIREEFEKLNEIVEILNRNGGGYYKENTNSYHHCNIYYDKYLNGAWYAFQEQQKKIDDAKTTLGKIYKETEGDDELLLKYLDEIQELLK